MCLQVAAEPSLKDEIVIAVNRKIKKPLLECVSRYFVELLFLNGIPGEGRCGRAEIEKPKKKNGEDEEACDEPKYTFVNRRPVFPELHLVQLKVNSYKVMVV